MYADADGAGAGAGAGGAAGGSGSTAPGYGVAVGGGAMQDTDSDGREMCRDYQKGEFNHSASFGVQNCLSFRIYSLAPLPTYSPNYAGSFGHFHRPV